MRRGGGVNYAKYGYIFCLPFVLAFLIFSLYPIVYTFILSFTDKMGLGMTEFVFNENPFSGFQNMLKNQLFMRSLQNTFIIWIFNFIPQIVLALVLTSWFTSRNYTLKGQGIFKVLIYMPNIITAATVAMLFSSLFMYPIGPINDLLQKTGIIQEPVYFLRSGNTAKGVISFIQFWMWYGHSMLILISGVLGMNPQMFEAAEIDGANATQTFFKITIPNLRTILLYTLITSLIGGLQMFDVPRVFFNPPGGPDNATLTVSLFIYNQAFSGRYMFGRAAVASVILFMIIVVLSLFIFFIMRDKDEIARRKAEKALIKGMRMKRGAVR